MPINSDASKYIPGLGSAFKFCCKDMDIEQVVTGLVEQGVTTADALPEQLSTVSITELADVNIQEGSEGRLLTVSEDGGVCCTRFCPEDLATDSYVYNSYKAKEYVLTNAPAGTHMDVKDHELEICIPDGVDWSAYYTTPGEGGEEDTCYVGLKVVAPRGTAKYQASSGSPLAPLDDIKDIDVAGDSPYTMQWLPVAALSGDTWSNYADGCTADRKIGWHYKFDFYNAEDELLESKRVRIVLANPTCFESSYEPYYISSSYVKKSNTTLSDSTATSVEELLEDYNALLAHLRTVGIIKQSE